MTILRLHADRLGTVQEITDYLHAVGDAYNHLYAFHFTIAEVKTRAEPTPISWRGTSRRALRLRVIRNSFDVVLPEDRLRLRAIMVQSPGSWDFLGAHNPLETLRKYLADRHERKKDRDYRNQLDEERLRIENERMRTEVVREQVDILREIGVPEDNIRTTLLRHVERPLARLDHVQDAGIINTAELLDDRGKGNES